VATFRDGGLGILVEIQHRFDGAAHDRRDGTPSNRNAPPMVDVAAYTEKRIILSFENDWRQQRRSAAQHASTNGSAANAGAMSRKRAVCCAVVGEEAAKQAEVCRSAC